MHTRAVKLSPLAANPPIQLNVLGHDRPLGVDGAQVGVLEQTHQVCFRSLLQGKHRMALETQISLHKYTARGQEKFLVILHYFRTVASHD